LHSCATTYQLEGGILDLSAGVRDGVLPDGDTDDLLQRLSELPSMGLYYEARMRPAYLSLSGTNWGGASHRSDEDNYIASQLRDSEGTVLDWLPVPAAGPAWSPRPSASTGSSRWTWACPC